VILVLARRRQTGAAQPASALKVIDPQHILTLGGDCSVSVAPFSWLAQRYGADLAVLWIDSHPDVGTPSGRYSGYHAMVVAVLIGHGDPDVLHLMPAILDPSRVALVGYRHLRQRGSLCKKRVISG
jgi:arginase